MPKKKRHKRCTEMPIEDKLAVLLVEILGQGAARVRTVRATYATHSYVRVAEAVLSDIEAARHYESTLHARKKGGFDPLAGMDPVESIHYPEPYDEDRSVVRHGTGRVPSLR